VGRGNAFHDYVIGNSRDSPLCISIRLYDTDDHRHHQEGYGRSTGWKYYRQMMIPLPVYILATHYDPAFTL